MEIDYIGVYTVATVVILRFCFNFCREVCYENPSWAIWSQVESVSLHMALESQVSSCHRISLHMRIVAYMSGTNRHSIFYTKTEPHVKGLPNLQEGPNNYNYLSWTKLCDCFFKGDWATEKLAILITVYCHCKVCPVYIDTILSSFINLA